MKKNWNTAIVVASALCLVSFVSSARAQYGACAPACDVPQPATCAPTCDLPAPSCGPGAYAEIPNCGPFGTCGSYDGGLCSLVDGAARAVVAPFKWVACAFTDGIYPDCGCAPVPPKSNCNPCTICGDYVGGCNDNCKYGQNCNTCPGDLPQYYQGAPETQPVEYYDSEAYDSSPTKANVNVPSFGSKVASRGAVRMTPNYNAMASNRARNANALPSFAEAPAQRNVRPVSYEQAPVRANQQRAAAIPAQNNLPRAPKAIRTAANLQEEEPAVRPADNANTKTFGVTRPVK